MITVSLDDIQRDLVGYLHLVEAGESLVIIHGDKPIAELSPAASSGTTQSLRPAGLCAGAFIVPDDFDAPLPDDVLSAFEGR